MTPTAINPECPVSYPVRQSSSFRSLAAALVGAKLAPFPRFIPPCLATLRSNVPTGPAFFEPRFDAEIMYADITDDGMVRHPVFKALHEPRRQPRC